MYAGTDYLGLVYSFNIADHVVIRDDLYSSSIVRSSIVRISIVRISIVRCELASWDPGAGRLARCPEWRSDLVSQRPRLHVTIRAGPITYCFVLALKGPTESSSGLFLTEGGLPPTVDG